MYIRKLIPTIIAAASAAMLLLNGDCTAQERIRIEGERATVGAMEGARHDVFGLLKAAGVDSIGRLYILDALDRRLKVMTQSGAFIASTGQEGRGPREFLGPVDLALAKDGTAAVLDPRNVRVSLYELSGDALQLSEEIPVRFPAKGICFLGNLLWVVGAHEGYGAHLIRQDGEIIRSIRRLTAGHPIIRRSSAGDLIACDDRDGQIYIASAIDPTVTAYDTAGTTLWSAAVGGFNALEVLVAESGGITYRSDNGRHHMITRMLPIRGNLLIQFGELSPETKTAEEVTHVQSQLLDGATGKEIRMTAGFPRLDAIRGTVGVGLANLPFPHIRVYELDFPEQGLKQ